MQESRELLETIAIAIYAGQEMAVADQMEHVVRQWLNEQETCRHAYRLEARALMLALWPGLT